MGLGEDERYRLTVGMINAFDKAPPAAKYTGYLQAWDLRDVGGRRWTG